MSLIAYGLAKNPDKLPDIWWGERKDYFLFRGEKFCIFLFKKMAISLISEAKNILNELIFVHHWPQDIVLEAPLKDDHELLHSIKENPREIMEEYSFMNDPRNVHLKDLESFALNIIMGSTHLEKEYLAMDLSGQNITWRINAVNDYLAKSERLLELIFLLVHITSGQPARGTEIIDLNLWNTPNTRRNIHVVDGRTMLVTRYDKTQNRTQSHKVICRFLPQTPSAILVKYIAIIRPLTIRFHQWKKEFHRNSNELSRAESLQSTTQTTHETSTTPELFPSQSWVSSSRVWNTERLTQVLTNASQQHMGMSISISTYRQCVEGIRKELVEKQEKSNHVFDRQAAHSANISDQHYGRHCEELADCPARQTWEYLCASLAWHKFLEIHPNNNENQNSDTQHPCSRDPVNQNILNSVQSPKRRRTESPTPPTPPNTSSDLGKTTYRNITVQLSKPIIRILSLLHSSNAGIATFKSQEQAFAVTRVLAQDSPLTIILGTGEGKTDTWLIPALMPTSRITVVILPLIALANDVERRAKEAGLSTFNSTDFNEKWELEYHDAEALAAPPFSNGVIVMTTDCAIQERFITYLCKSCVCAP